MMKKMVVVLAMALGLSCAGQVEAADSSVDGMLLGAGGGALVGQALGHNTRSTLLGAAVGTVIGYAIDSDGDRGPRRRYGHRPRTIVVRPESRDTCEEMEMLATINGRAETVYGLACWQDGEWVRVVDEPMPPVVYETIIIRDEHHRHGGHHRHNHGGYERRWGRHDHDRHESRRHGHDRHQRPERIVNYRSGW